MNKLYKVISTFLISLLLLNPCFAQEEQKNLIYEFSDFSKGLNTKLSDYSLPSNQATIAENCRFNTQLKSLSSRDKVLLYGTATLNEPITSMHRLYLNDTSKVLLVTHGNEIKKGNDASGAFTNILTLTTGDRRFKWVTWHNQAIGTDGYNQPVKYDGSSVSVTYLGTCLATATTTGAGPSGTYNYKVTFYSATKEISLGVASNSVTVTDKDINLSMIPIGPDTILGETITGRKIYRSDNAGGGTYKLLSNGTIANNTATTLTDSDADAALGATLSPTATYTPPKGKFILVHKNRLWIANNPDNPSTVYYSEDASPDYFIPTDLFNVRLNDGDEIAFIENLLGILTVGKTNTIQKIYTEGDTPSSDWAISDPFSFIGCRAPYSVKVTPIGIIYLSGSGLYKFNGQYSALISDAVTPEIQDISDSNFANCVGEFYKNIYYLAYTSKKTGSSVNDKVFVYDLLSDAYSIDILGINAFTTFSSGSDWESLYAGSSASDGKVYTFTETTNELKHRKHSDFTGDFYEARYIPTRWGGDADNPVIEMARSGTIDGLPNITIDSLTGNIDRFKTTGYYISQFLTIRLRAFDKLYWNEILPATGGDTTLALRNAANTADCLIASWSAEKTDPSGSDISAITVTNSVSGDSIVQYRISMTTTDLDYTPTLYKLGEYVVKLTYVSQGSSTETSIPLHWVSGWNDLGLPGTVKVLKKIYVYYESESTGTLTIKFTNLEGRENTFNIDLLTNPSSYVAYFTTGMFRGELFKLDIFHNDLKKIKVKKIIIIFDKKPLV